MEDNEKERCALTGVIETELEILRRHVNVLKTLQENQPMGIIKLAELTDYPQHMVRYSLRMLEHEGVVEPSSKGAVTTDEVPKTLHSLKNALNGISKTVDKVIAALE